MDILRYGEIERNSSLRAIIRHANASHQLARDLRDVANKCSLPSLDAASVPLVDMWFVEKCMLPMLVGHISYPDRRTDVHGTLGGLSFTAPLHLLSVGAGLARSAQRWYRLGRPSPIAEDSVARWDTSGKR